LQDGEKKKKQINAVEGFRVAREQNCVIRRTVRNALCDA
jgi:hypothetical protein